MSEELRMYSFNSMYMNGIHNGIQAGHSWVDMAVKYMFTGTVANTVYWQWAKNHKTVVVKNGGDETSLIDLIKVLQACEKTQDGHVYPWIEWREPALNYRHPPLTSVSVVLPARIFSHKMYKDSPRGFYHDGEKYVTQTLTETDQMLYDYISSKRFAQ